MSKSSNSVIFVLGILVALLMVVVGALYNDRMHYDETLLQYPKINVEGYPSNRPVVDGDTVMCPMDAKRCADGKTYVPRTGPKCTFALCPEEKEGYVGTLSQLEIDQEDLQNTDIKSELSREELKLAGYEIKSPRVFNRSVDIFFQKERGIYIMKKGSSHLDFVEGVVIGDDSFVSVIPIMPEGIYGVFIQGSDDLKIDSRGIGRVYIVDPQRGVLHESAISDVPIQKGMCEIIDPQEERVFTWKCILG